MHDLSNLNQDKYNLYLSEKIHDNVRRTKL